MGTMWQHVDIDMKEMNEPYETRKRVFFNILRRLMGEGHIKLASNGVFLSGTIEEQVQSVNDIWPLYPADSEDDDLDDTGMWFYVKLTCGLVWMTPDGREVWT